MRDLILKAIEEDKNYLEVEGDNELDKDFYQGRIEAFNWVLRNLPEEG